MSSTYRDRRAERADRLREWAGKRERNARATLAANDALPYAHDIAFLTQPGRIIARERMNASEDRAYRSLDKADAMARRADEIDRQADRAIYSDDPDAAERLAEKLADLEAARAHMVAVNAAIRRAVKGTTTHAERAPILAELARAGVMTVDDLDDLMSTARAFGPYYDRRPVQFSTDNIGGQITKTRERIASLSAPARPRALRVISARRPGKCDDCGRPIAAGDPISPAPDGSRVWIHTACAQGSTD